MTTWTRHLYEHDHLAISKGESNDYSTVYKFGFNPDINGDEETIWTQGGNVPWPTTAFTAYAVSDNAADANGSSGANTVEVEGLDADYNFKSVSVSMNGTNAVEISGTWIRINRAYVTLAGSGGTSAGTIHIQNSGGTVIYANLAVGNQTQMAVYTVPAGHTFYVDDISFTAALSQANKRIRATFAVREFGSNVFRTRLVSVLQSTHLVTRFVYPLAIPEKADMECRGFSDTINNEVGASFQGVLCKNTITGEP